MSCGRLVVRNILNDVRSICISNKLAVDRGFPDVDSPTSTLYTVFTIMFSIHDRVDTSSTYSHHLLTTRSLCPGHLDESTTCQRDWQNDQLSNLDDAGLSPNAHTRQLNVYSASVDSPADHRWSVCFWALSSPSFSLCVVDDADGEEEGRDMHTESHFGESWSHPMTMGSNQNHSDPTPRP